METVLGEELTVSQLRNSIRAKEEEIREAHDVATGLRSLGDALQHQRMRDMNALKEAGVNYSLPRLFSQAEARYTSPQFSVLREGLYRSSFEAMQEVQRCESELTQLRKDLRTADRENHGKTF